MLSKAHTPRAAGKATACRSSAPAVMRDAARPMMRRASAAAAGAPAAEPLPVTCWATENPLLSRALVVELPPGTSAEAWAEWMGQELAAKLVGVEARTSRAQVRTVAALSAKLIKGPIRAEELDVVLELEGRHLKDTAASSITGSIRIVLKTEERRDVICLSSPQWTSAASTSPQVLADITAAADVALESALASHLNDVLWDIEHRSIDESMDE